MTKQFLYFQSVRSALFLVCFSLLPFPTGVSAQEGAAGLEEVIVTARKRDESLFEIPESISTFSATEIEKANMELLEDIGLMVPNLNLSERLDGYPNVTIRGVGSFGNTQGVGFYVDDIQNFYDAHARYGDIERIEVLKGPQGTLYGGSNIGGAVKWVTKRPDTEAFSAWVQGEFGEQSTLNFDGSINAPLSDSWAARLYAYHADNDGFLINPDYPTRTGLHNPVKRHLDRRKESGFRATLLGNPTDKLTVFATLRLGKVKGANNEVAFEFDRDHYTYSRLRPLTYNPIHDKETWTGSLQLDYDLGATTLTYLGSYTDFEQFGSSDPDTSPNWGLDVRGPWDAEVLTQELRLASNNGGPFEWLVGLYYLDRDYKARRTVSIYPNAAYGFSGLDVFLNTDFFPETEIVLFPPFFAGVPVPFEFRDEQRKNYAAFFTASYRMDKFEIGVGGRVDKWKVHSINRANDFPGKQSDTEFLPKVSLSYYLNESNSMLYANFAKGFEPGGFNDTNFEGSNELFGYGIEEAYSYEVGYKGELAENKFQLTLAGFLVDYRDRQYELQRSDPNNPAGFVEGIINAGDSEQFGAEIDIAWRASDYLTISASAGFIDAEWDDGTIVNYGAGPSDISGKTPMYVPERSYAVRADYVQPVFADFDFWGRLQVSHEGEVQSDLENTWQIPSYTVVNLSFGIRNPHWEFSVDIKNLFDEDYFVDAQLFPAFDPLTCPDQMPGCVPLAPTLGQPRWITGSVKYKF